MDDARIDSEVTEHACADPHCPNLAPPDQLYCEHHLRGLDVPLAVTAPADAAQQWARSALLSASSMLAFWACVGFGPRSALAPAFAFSLHRAPAASSVALRPSVTLPLAIAAAFTGFVAAAFAVRRARNKRERARSWVLVVLGAPHLLAGLALSALTIRELMR